MMRAGWVAAMVAVAAPVAAEAPDQAGDRALAPFLACRETADPAARAACYDAALDRFRQAVAARQVVIVDHQQAVEDRRSLFGFGVTHGMAPPKPVKTATSATKPASEDVAEINSTVLSAQAYGYDQWVIRIATGATWRTTESGIPIQPKPGEKIRVHRGVMNGYMLRVGSGRTVRAIRVG